MIRWASISIVLASTIHCFRFGIRLSDWRYFLGWVILLGAITFSDILSEFSTGWIQGSYVDEATPSLVFKVLGFLGVLFFSFLFATTQLR